MLLVLLGTVLQVGALLLASSDGKADPTLARSHVRHLSAARNRVNRAKSLAEQARESELDIHAWRDTVGMLSVHLSYVEEDMVLAIEDWFDFSSEALKEAVEESKEGKDEQN
ncbi:hypothetical protein [Paeniglutamicibacter psychrophenolicus]|uniref:hypothetical protein n=1 Tax=Paeniglutamicibacter psychrophenolicus TaxID=257454 RepID=UPI0027889A45|nr:hypothetical protein [Paeniglutamicibacter psychrophenolicus]MDQ0094811.1 hypothetical protein [Paeniglutamicibacter psychrophenolicus]